jgi:small subunit ribosomal protein S8
MTHDTISDMLTRIRNAIYAKHKSVGVLNTKTTRAIAMILIQEGFLKDAKVIRMRQATKSKPRQLKLILKYRGKRACISHLKTLSRPSLRLYAKHKDIPRALDGMGLVILTTSQGIMTGRAACAKRLGGEVLCELW